MTRSVYDLDVYKRAYAAALEIHRFSLTLPKIEQYALGDQVRRASRSICANLAEGFVKSKGSQSDFRRFLLIALGSAEEMRVWLDFARDLDYGDRETLVGYKENYAIICRQLNTLINRVSENV